MTEPVSSIPCREIELRPIDETVVVEDELVIEDEGVPLVHRGALNFVGAGVTATDDPANDRVNVDIPGLTGSGVGIDFNSRYTMDAAGNDAKYLDLETIEDSDEPENGWAFRLVAAAAGGFYLAMDNASSIVIQQNGGPDLSDADYVNSRAPTWAGLTSFTGFDGIQLVNNSNTDFTILNTGQGIFSIYNTDGPLQILTGGDNIVVSATNIGYILLKVLPTADPHVVDAIWNSAGTLKISAG
jgi:hypothetical protein